MKYVITETQYKLILEDGLNVEPSKTAVKNICDSKKFCNAQGKITFGQLKELVKAASKTRLYKHMGEGGFKATIRLIPFFLPQLMIPGIIAGAARAVNKILKPGLTETESYKTFWGKSILRAFKIAEGDIDLEDPLSKIFFISDGLMTMMDDKYKVKFARYIADLADEKPDDEEVPEYFVENELRNWVNDKFVLDPPLPPKTSPNQDLDLGDQETLKEEKSDKREMFQEMINEKLDYIRKGCDDISHESFPNDISFSSCDVIDNVDSITVDEVRMISGSRTDMYGNMYDTTSSLYIKVTINISSARTGYGYEDLIYDLKLLIRKSSGGLMVVFDYKTHNTFND
jgi:hypothetical protein